ncbi:MAG: response regulator [Sulfuricella sp.]|nr:response regulator [Sulfuricella sp.]
MNQASPGEIKQLSVLYAEDDDHIRKEVAHFLKPRVGEPILADNGQAALAAFKARQADIIISDIMMPLMDGLELAAAVKELNAATPVIFTTAFNDVKYLHRAIALGVDGYALKPIDLKQLLEAIAKSAAMLFKNRDLATGKAQLEAYHQAAEEERRLVAELMARMIRPENLHDAQLHCWLKPTDVVSGDLIAASRSRNRKLYLMLADSTGHGLPAAQPAAGQPHFLATAQRFTAPTDTLNAHLGKRHAFDDMTLMLVECGSGAR